MKRSSGEVVAAALAGKISPEQLKDVRDNLANGNSIAGLHIPKGSCWPRIRKAFVRFINQLSLSRMQES